MSSIEERLEQDIAHVVGRVVVTESDLRTARDAIDERIESRQRQGRRRALASLAAAAITLPVLGYVGYQAFDGNGEAAQPAHVDTDPGHDRNEDAWLKGDPATPDQLHGVWRVDGDTLVLRFTSAGRVSLDEGGQLFGDPDVTGTYSMDGDRITVDIDGGTAGCEGQALVLRASVPDESHLRVVGDQPAASDCSFRAIGYWTLEGLLPTIDLYADESFVPQPSDVDFRPVESATYLPGDWMANGGGHMLELDSSGAFYVADGTGEVVDQCSWTYADGSLALTSSADSATCLEGDRVVLGRLAAVNPGTPMLRGSLEQNSCGAAWANVAWWLVPSVSAR
jgi:hypothetical protein